MRWLGAVFRIRPDGHREFLGCAGTLIHPQWVVTAAHCQQSNPRSLRVVFGRGDLQQTGGDEHEVCRIETRGFDGRTSLNDIALYQLKTPAAIDPVRYRDAPTALERANAPARAYGWGDTPTRRGGRNTVLKTVSVRIVTAEIGLPQSVDLRYFICTRSRPTDLPLGHGDSGGPVIATAPNGTPYVIGIISFSSKRERRNENRITVHTRVSAYQSWIAETIARRSCDSLPTPSQSDSGSQSPSGYNGLEPSAVT